MDVYKFLDGLPSGIQEAIDNKQYLALHIGLFSYVIVCPTMWIAHFFSSIIKSINNFINKN